MAITQAGEALTKLGGVVGDVGSYLGRNVFGRSKDLTLGNRLFHATIGAPIYTAASGMFNIGKGATMLGAKGLYKAIKGAVKHPKITVGYALPAAFAALEGLGKVKKATNIALRQPQTYI